MRITNFAVRHRIPVFVLMVGIFLMGVFSYATLPRESTPDIKVPLVTVAVPWPEASPADVENSITVPLERELRNLKGLKELSSVSSEGISVTTAEFDPSVPVEEALQKVRERFDRVKGDFPADVDDETIEELSFSEFPIMIVTLFGAHVTVLERVAEELEDRIEQIEGVLSVGIIGGVEPQIEIEIDPEKLEAYRLPVNQLIDTLRGENLDVSAGGVDTGGVKPSVRVPGEFKTPADVEGLIIHVVDGRPVYLRDVARAFRSYKDPVSYARRDGEPAVQLTITKRAGADIIAITAMVRYGMALAKAEFPAGVDYAILTDASDDIRTMVNDLENNILSGLVLVLLVIFFALGIRNAIFVAMAIPFSMLMSLFILQAMGVTLNMVVLFALILAQGMLVDNAIVIIENVYRHVGMKKSPVQAAIDAVKEVAWPVIAATATTVAAFAPLLFWPGIMGEFMQYLPLTVVTTLSASLFVALVINPTLAATFMRFKKPSDKPISRKVEGFGYKLLDAYELGLRKALRWPKALLLGALVALIGTVVVYANLGKEPVLFPRVEPKLAFVNITAAEGTSLQKTDELTKIVESRLPESPDIKGLETAVGGVGTANPMDGGADATHLARITVSFKDQEDRVGSPSDWIRRARDSVKDLPGADFEVIEQAMGPPTGRPITIEIMVDDQARMGEAVQRVRRIVEDTQGTIDIRDTFRTGKPELRIRVDRQKAALLGLNTQWIGNFVKMLINGQRIGGYDDGREERDIIVRLPAERRNDPAVLDSIRISDRFGNAIPLSTICTWEYVGGPGTIRRKDGQRMMMVTADVADNATPGALLARIAEKIEAERMTLPPGFRYKFAGEQQDMQEAGDFLTKAFVIAMLAITLILVLQFNSLLQSGIILSSVILSTIGVMVSLLVLNKPFSIVMTGVAIIALAGVVVNNAIVMIDFINQLRRIHGRSLVEAIVEGGRTRLRPVMLTAITTSLGLAPMALGFSFDFFRFEFVLGGESSAWWAPLATAMIFGLMIATVLTLVLVPCAYLVTARWSELAGKLFIRLFGSPNELDASQQEEPGLEAAK